MSSKLSSSQLNFLLGGTVIPAHPLALNKQGRLDERRQRALTRYYMDAGAGGIAVGVHTTQFEIRNPEYDLYKPVLQTAVDEVNNTKLKRHFLKIAGVCGPTAQAVKEASLAESLGYDLALLSMGGLDDLSEDQLIKRTEKISEIMPVFGFYLQPSVGGRYLRHEFWKRFSEVPNVFAIKIAPFNRYYTLDVVRAVCCSSRNDSIAIYTGNDDNILIDLLTTYRFNINGRMVEKDIVGGLLGQWAVWTKKAVELLEAVKLHKKSGTAIDLDWLTLNAQITDSNAAIFDPAHDFKGCISGIHEVLRRQGLMENTACLLDSERLSPGQMEEIDRVYKAYPNLNDDDFVKANLDKWLAK